MRFNDAVPGVLLMVLAAFGLHLVSAFPRFPGEEFGPDLFPRIILIVLGGTGAILTAQGLMHRRSQPMVSLEGWARSPRAWGSLVLIIALVGGYIASAPVLGFPVAGFLMMFTLLLWARGVRRAAASAMIAAVAVAALYIIFVKGLRVPLPLGPLVHL